MSQREMLLVLAQRTSALPAEPPAERPRGPSRGRSLSDAEKDTLAGLKFEDFLTPELLARAAGCTVTEPDEYRDEPVVRFRHF